MPNQPGSSLPNRFRSGQALTAADLNKIVAMVVQRITGGSGIRVRGFGGQIVIESTPSPSRASAAEEGTSVKIGFIATGSGSGPYTVNVMDNGTDQSPTEQVDAYPLLIAAGQSFPANTGVILVWVQGANNGNGRWYFQGPVWLTD